MTKSVYNVNKLALRQSFDSCAHSYDEHAVLQHEVGQRVLQRLDLIKIKPQLVLDAGTGTGKQSLALVKRYKDARIVSLDLASSMLQHARKRKPWLAKQSFVCADIEHMPLPDNSVDLLFSNLTLQWCTEYDRVFTEVDRVLKPGGLFIYSTFGPDTLKELRQSWQQVDNNIHVNAFMDMHDIGDAMMRSGFEDPVVDMETFTLTYGDVYALMRDIKGIGAHNLTHGRAHGLTGKNKMSAMVANYELFRRDKLIPATYEVIYGHAWGNTGKRKQNEPESDFAIPIDQIGRRPRG